MFIGVVTGVTSSEFDRGGTVANPNAEIQKKSECGSPNSMSLMGEGDASVVSSVVRLGK